MSLSLHPTTAVWLIVLFVSAGLHASDIKETKTSPTDQNDTTAKSSTSTSQANRIEQLNTTITTLRNEARYDDAILPAEEHKQLLCRRPVVEPWKCQDATRLIETLTYIASLPEAARVRLAAADADDARVDRQFIDGHYDDGIALAENQLAVRKELLGFPHIDTINTLNNLAAHLERKGDYATGERFSQEAIAGCKKLFDGSHPYLAASLINYGVLLKSKGDFTDARQPYSEAIDILKRLPGDVHPHLPIAMNNLANLLIAQGDWANAETLMREALDLRRPILPARHPSIAMGLNNLAVLLQYQGKHGDAEPLHREALQIYRTLFGDEHIEVARTLAYLAGITKDQGDEVNAERLFRQALRIQRSILGDEHTDTAITMNNLAQVLEESGRLSDAREHYVRALDIIRSVKGDSHPKTATAMKNLASLERHSGNLDRARSLYDEALRIERAKFGDDGTRLAGTLQHLASLALESGDLPRAEKLFRQAIALQRRVSNARSLARALTGLGKALYARDEYENAEAVFTEAADWFEINRIHVSASGLGRTKQASRNSPLLHLVACLLRNGKHTKAWHRSEESLARSLLDLVSVRGATRYTNEELTHLRELQRALDAAEEKIAITMSAQHESVHPPTTADNGWFDVGAKQKDLTVFQTRLAEKYGAPTGQVFDLSRVQRSLRTDVAMIGWVDLNGSEYAADPNGEHWAYVIRGQGTPNWTRLPGTGKGGKWALEDTSLCARAREAIRHHPSQQDRADWKQLAAQLFDQRVAPVEHHLAGVNHLIVLPAGSMAGIPVAALTEAYSISYAPSGTIYAWLQESKEAKKKSMEESHEYRLLAVGDPLYSSSTAVAPTNTAPPEYGVFVARVKPESNAANNGLKIGDVLLSYNQQKLDGRKTLSSAIKSASSSLSHVPVSVWRNGQTLSLSLQPGRLGVVQGKSAALEEVASRRKLNEALRGNTTNPAPLPGTRREVQSIARIFADAYGGGHVPTVLLGSKASEGNLNALADRDELRSYRFLHFATHGRTDDRAILASALILSNNADTLGKATDGITSTVHDGRLTANNIIRTWNLDADLVTLSACETALGKESGGEGYLGFSQALFVAGARSLLLSLWKVDDTATTLLMTRFYENLLGAHDDTREVLGRKFSTGDAMSKSVALLEAKNWLKSQSPEENQHVAQGAKMRGHLGGQSAGLDAAAELDFSDPFYWAGFILIGDPE